MQALMGMKFADFTVREMTNGEVHFIKGDAVIVLPALEVRNLIRFLELCGQNDT